MSSHWRPPHLHVCALRLQLGQRQSLPLSLGQEAWLRRRRRARLEARRQRLCRRRGCCECGAFQQVLRSIAHDLEGVRLKTPPYRCRKVASVSSRAL
jgi:hypothetical protein